MDLHKFINRGIALAEPEVISTFSVADVAETLGCTEDAARNAMDANPGMRKLSDSDYAVLAADA